MKKCFPIIYFLALLFLFSCKGTGNPDELSEISIHDHISSDSLLSQIQHKTFLYFWDGAEPISGMSREFYQVGNQTQHPSNIIITGGTGFGVMAIIVGIERGFISRDEGLNRVLQIVDFLKRAKRYHGAWPHLMNSETGKTVPFSDLDNGADIVETAYLMQGLLTAKQYFNNNSVREKLLVKEIDQLWREVEWSWFTKGEDMLYRHWSPDYGWQMNQQLWGWDEYLILYVLAASSPTFPIKPSVYHNGWAKNGEIIADNKAFGYPLILRHNQTEEFGGPLSWSQKSFIGLDPRNLTDSYANYWQVNINHALVNRQWCVENHKKFKGYGKNCWGITTSFSPSGFTLNAPGEQTDKGIISPSAAIGSLPYSPDFSMEAINFFYYNQGDKLFGKYGFYDAFSINHNWYPKIYFAENQGVIIAMIENYRTSLIWDHFMSIPEIQEGLKKLGFNF